ncbi:phosphoribosyl 1,2-cyclic phosphodiesterase [Pedobacter sp. CG_S7]|uniref:MBL fold metallo-hydrolase n=1 Tax=Pedobacter sp. CG_S7 TaxID=3143930 RepID=UPI0033925F44
MACNTLFITSLNSGSNGNCYYVGNKEEAILIDAGISCKETEIRMQRLGLSMGKVKAIFISHEHSDHIRGVCVMARKYQIPVYITPATRSNCKFKIKDEQFRDLRSHEINNVGNLKITAFPKIHDAAEPHSFIVTCGETKVGVFTDLGIVCKELISHFKQCNAAFLEANYDEEMLQNGNYPYHLKERIRGGEGHLSNKQALELFIEHKPAFMTHLLLSHLSKDNNSPELVQQLFETHAGNIKVIIASRFAETPIFSVKAEIPIETALPAPTKFLDQLILFPSTG